MRAGAEGDAAKVRRRLTLEPGDEPLLLRFVEGPGGPRAVFGEEDPAPAECAERFLLQSAQDGKRRRTDGGEDDAQAEDERVQALHEAQRSALEGLRRVSVVSELLQRSTWGHDNNEHTRFLHLHAAVQGPVADEEAQTLVQEREAAMAAWPAQLREAGAALAAASHHTELEGVLRHLRRQWLVHCVGGRYVVELWNDSGMTKATDPKKGLAGKYVAIIGQHPQRGVCLTFPHEIGRFVEWRHRLAVRIAPLRAVPAHEVEPARQAAPPAMALRDAAMSRGEAMNLVLAEARDVVVDLCILRRLRDGLSQSDGERWLRWHVLRASSSEIALAVPVGPAAELVHIAVKFGGAARDRGAGEERRPGDVWDWLGRAALLRLRELFLWGPLADISAEGIEATEAASSDLFADFTRWIEPQLEKVAAFAKGRK